MVWQSVAQVIKRFSGEGFELGKRVSVRGGCINQGYKVVGTDGRRYFVKLNTAARLEMFESEALGLVQMGETGTIRVPGVVGCGVSSDQSFLVLEWLDLGGRGDRRLGEDLARLHQVAGATAFGWERDNRIGATIQKNSWMRDWSGFWRENRLGVQLALGGNSGGHFPKGNQLLNAIPSLLADHCPQPSLVHGDLWGGNAGVMTDGAGVIFDPAVYWGDREVDLAMTELFGGFSREFYAGYESVWPLDEGYTRRKVLYNLYHILNHYNLFGGSYEGQANAMIDLLLGGV